MKQAKGWIADDGSFFENERDCDLYEAETALREAAVVNRVNADSFVNAVNLMFSLVKRYIDAHEGKVAEGRGDQRDARRAKEADDPAQQLKAGGSQSVPYVGRRERKEKV